MTISGCMFSLTESSSDRLSLWSANTVTDDLPQWVPFFPPSSSSSSPDAASAEDRKCMARFLWKSHSCLQSKRKPAPGCHEMGKKLAKIDGNTWRRLVLSSVSILRTVMLNHSAIVDSVLPPAGCCWCLFAGSRRSQAPDHVQQQWICWSSQRLEQRKWVQLHFHLPLDESDLSWDESPEAMIPYLKYVVTFPHVTQCNQC